MNKIVREHYPVDRLPEDLREGIEGPYVSVVIETEKSAPRPQLTWQELRAKLKERQVSVTTEEAVARIRALRDEWER